jgi:hypothetical protein
MYLHPLRLLAIPVVVMACQDQPLTAPARAIELKPVASLATDAASTFTFSKNMHPVGFSARTVPLSNGSPGSGLFNSDLAFWGDRAYQGTFEGFRIIDISRPDEPVQLVNYVGCSPGSSAGNQGDVAVWNNILVRSWNSAAPAGAMCGGAPVPLGGQGIHIFDVSNPASPVLLKLVPLPCGAKASTIVPDLANNRLVVYSAGASPLCPQVEISVIPLAAPTTAFYLRGEPTAPDGTPATRSCTDVAVITGSAMRLACPSGSGGVVWSIGGAAGGSLLDPMHRSAFSIGGVGFASNITWTPDGKVMVFGHMAGGGSAAHCESTDNSIDRTIFFLDGAAGAMIGTFTLERFQTDVENCALGGFSVVPVDKRYVLVAGNFQSGISVVDFTKPDDAVEIAYADPGPLVDPDPPVGIELGGMWSAHYYRGFIYASDITRGLSIWKHSSSLVAGAKRLNYLNPQTVEPTTR